MKLIIQRNPKIIVASVEIDEATIYSSELLGMDKVTASFIVNSPIYFQIDDYIIHNNRQFSIKTGTSLEQIDNHTYKYEITFYAEIYSLYDEIITHLGRTTFSYTGTPSELLSLLITNLNTSQTGWSIGSVINITEPQTFSFAEQSCRVALSDIAAKFECEYQVENKKISLIKKIGQVHQEVLQYGKGQGLFHNARTIVDNPYATVWLIFGGSQNLPTSYRNGQNKLTLSNPIEKNVSLYGRKKGSITFDYIYPRRTATLTSIVDYTTVVDSTLDFDLNAQIISDGSAKIVFKSGELGGQEFVITSYTHSTKTIRFGSTKDQTGYVMPNATFKPKMGDKYTLVGIVMPDSYITAAEQELSLKGQEYADKNSYPPVSFPLNIDEKYIREMGLAYKYQAGDSVHVKSDSLGIDTLMRLQSISYPLVNPCKLTGTVSDFQQYSITERIVKEVKATVKQVEEVATIVNSTKQQADEIANAAILQQFKKTYVGDNAVLSGAFIVGNSTSGQVGGVSGSGTEATEVVFFAGASFANRSQAPFRALRNGNTFASKLDIANGCKIGAFTVEDNVLYRKTAVDPVTPNTNYVRIGDDFVFRKTLGDYAAKEIIFAISNPVGTPNYAIRIGNSINPFEGEDVIGLFAYASGATGGGRSIAIQTDGAIALNGKMYSNGHEGASVSITISGTTMIFRNGILTTT